LKGESIRVRLFWFGRSIGRLALGPQDKFRRL
jgi:hypothetical protein